MTLILGLCAYISKGISCYHAFDWLAVISVLCCLAGLGISIYTVVYLFELAGRMPVDTAYKGIFGNTSIRQKWKTKLSLGNLSLKYVCKKMVNTR